MHTGSYAFRAERRVAGTSQLQDSLNLAPDASNLAGALHYLYASNPRKFGRLLEFVRQVLPDIETVTAIPTGGQVQIRIWNSGYEEERSDLAIPLEECGTGIGQLLAILYVVVTAESGLIIVIDEPNSFLHPGASRTLMQILRGFDNHQYVISTHSPEIIGAVSPDKLIVVKWASGESRVTIYDGTEVEGLRTAFSELGVRLSDVFGYDAVAWVEGPTEAKCFPALLEVSGKKLPSQAAFVPLANTGDVEGSDAETVWRAYKELARQSAVVPRAICISLDSESRSAAQKADLSIRSDGLVRFLPRRTYENYLLHPAAIAAVLNQKDSGCALSSEDVEKWISDHRKDAKYYARNAAASEKGADWQKYVAAPKLLHDLIGNLTNHTQDFSGRKIAYSSAITDWLLKNDKKFLVELIEYVASLVAEEPK